MAIKLQGFKTPFCGSWMKSTKKSKVIVEKSTFQKVYFPHDFQNLKFMHIFGVKRQICPFFLKKRNFWGSNSNEVTIKVVVIQITNSKRLKSIFFKNQTQTSHANTYNTGNPGPCQTKLNALKIFQSYSKF